MFALLNNDSNLIISDIDKPRMLHIFSKMNGKDLLRLGFKDLVKLLKQDFNNNYLELSDAILHNIDRLIIDGPLYNIDNEPVIINQDAYDIYSSLLPPSYNCSIS